MRLNTQDTNNAWQVMQWVDLEPEANKLVNSRYSELASIGKRFDAESLSKLLCQHCPVKVADSDIVILVEEFNESLGTDNDFYDYLDPDFNENKLLILQ